MVAVLGLVIGVVAVALAAWGLKVAIRSSKSADESASAAKSSAASAKQILDMAEADQQRRDLVRVRSRLLDIQTLHRKQGMDQGPLAIWSGAPEMMERSDLTARLAAAIPSGEWWHRRLQHTEAMSTCPRVNWSSTLIDQALDETKALLDELPGSPRRDSSTGLGGPLGCRWPDAAGPR